MKVLMLGWEFPPLINGGLGIACLGIAKALGKKVELTVILPKSDPDFILDNVPLIGLNNVDIQDIYHEQGISYYKDFENVSYVSSSILPYQPELIEGQNNSVEILKEKNNTTTHKTPLGTFQIGEIYGEEVNSKVVEFSKYAAAIASQIDFDIVYGHDWMSVLAGIEIKNRTGKPFALHVHALTYDRSGPESRGWVFDLEKYGMEKADLVIPVSNYTAGIVKDHYGINSNKVLAVHNGVDPVKAFREKNTFPEFLVLFLGRITGQKGPEIFLEIASKVLAKENNVRFVMAGTGDQLKRVIESGAYKKVGYKFHFTGFLNKEKVNKLLSMADVYCMPSVSEPFGLSALEAAQFGIPCVISKQSGAAEVMKNALQADFWDVDLMAEHIIRLISDKKLRKEVITQTYKDIEKLNWDNSMEKVMEGFERVIKTKP